MARSNFLLSKSMVDRLVVLNNRCQVDPETQENGLETDAILEHVPREDVILVVLASTWLSHPTMERLANWWETYLGTNLPAIFRGETTDVPIADLDHMTMEQHLRSHAWASGRNKLEQAEPHERGYSPEEGFTPDGINGGQSSHGEYPTLFPNCRTSTANCRSQWALPDLNRELQIPVGTDGPQPRAPDPSGHCRTSTARRYARWNAR